jgi:translation initiation factor 4A
MFGKYKYMTEISVFDNEVDNIVNSWDDLDIPVQLLRGIYAYGFEHMSPIQKKAIQPMMIGRDIIAQAQSGTGKTATFTIGSLSNINLELNHPQVLVLSPTRELSKQTASVFNGIGCMMNGLQIQTLVGGSSVDDDLSILRNNPPHVVVGCPGRVFDILKKNHVICKNIKTIIMDEADEMLSFGFKEQVYNILQLLDKNIQICLFSATLPDYINVIIDKIMKNPIRIQVKSEQLTLEGISQYYIAIENDQQKYDTLKDLYSILIHCFSLM